MIGANEGDILEIVKYQETVILPVYFFKLSDGKLQFTKDPYAGNTAAFAELLAYDSTGQKTRGLLAYAVSTNPPDFDIHSKRDTNIYRAVAKYADVLVIDGSEVISQFLAPTRIHATSETYALDEITPTSTTEDMAIVSTYLQMGVIAGDWDACMISIHHSSWQQIRLRDGQGRIRSTKIPRNSSKVDLVMQSPQNIFLAAEGKRKYGDFFATPAERSKIQQAFLNVRSMINDSFDSLVPEKITAFICLLDIPELDSEYFLNSEKSKIIGSINKGHLDSIAGDDYVVIGVYTIFNQTHFELFFSKQFPERFVKALSKIFL